MQDTVAVHVNTLPGLLHKGDFVSVPGAHDLVLSEHPEPNALFFRGQLCQIYCLTGHAADTQYRVKIAVSARMSLDCVREFQLNGRSAPVFVAPVAKSEHTRSGAYLY